MPRALFPLPSLLRHHDAHLLFWNTWAVPTAPISQAQMVASCRHVWGAVCLWVECASVVFRVWNGIYPPAHGWVCVCTWECLSSKMFRHEHTCVHMHMNGSGWGACGWMCSPGLWPSLPTKAALTRYPGSEPKRKAQMFLSPATHAPRLPGQSEKRWLVDTQDYRKGISDAGH